MVLGYPEYESGKHRRKGDPPATPPIPAMQPEPPTEISSPVPPMAPAVPEPEPQKESSMLGNLLGENAKAIMSFAVTFGGQLLARAFVDGTPVLPSDVRGWLGLIGGSLLAAALVWLKGNTESVDTLQRKLDKAAVSGKDHA